MVQDLTHLPPNLDNKLAYHQWACCCYLLEFLIPQHLSSWQWQDNLPHLHPLKEAAPPMSSITKLPHLLTTKEYQEKDIIVSPHQTSLIQQPKKMQTHLSNNDPKLNDAHYRSLHK